MRLRLPRKASSSTTCGARRITAIEVRLSRTPAADLGYGDVERRRSRARGGATLAQHSREAIWRGGAEAGSSPTPPVWGNAGSFFKNPSWRAPRPKRCRPVGPGWPLPAADPTRRSSRGWLIDKAGLKGHAEGRVGVHERQALVLVNRGGATGGEVIAFARKVQAAVRDRFGIDIDTEVNIL